MAHTRNGAGIKLTSYIGQDHVKRLLQAEIHASRTNGKPLRHGLFFGPSGIGKTTLARAIADELGYRFWSISPTDCTPKYVQSFLLRLPTGGYSKSGLPDGSAVKHLVFIDEVHDLPSFESWYDPLQECQIAHGGGVSWLPYFTMLGATNKPDLLPKPFVDRCPLQYTLRPYTVPQFAQIVRGKFPQISEETAQEIGRRARNSPRIALGFAESVLNFGGLHYFDEIGIDADGMTELDRGYVKALENSTGPMGIGAISAVLGQDVKVISGVVEPYLVSIGKVEITAKGRVLTSPGRGSRAMPVAVSELVGFSGRSW